MKTSSRKSTTGSVQVNLAGKSLLAAAAFALVGAGTVNAGLDPTQFGGWSEIGDLGNGGDTQTYDAVYQQNDGDTAPTDYTFGTVGYTYRIGQFEVSKDDLYSAGLGGISGNDDPAVNISLYGAMAYANALTRAEYGHSNYNVYTLNKDGSNPDSNGYTGYSINYSRQNAINEGKLVYAIPTENEWYKAAYYDPDKDSGSGGYWEYATEDTNLINNGSGTFVPPDTTSTDNSGWNYNGPNTVASGVWTVGSSKEELNQTHDMMGNVWEWTEDSYGVVRGGQQGNYANGINSSNRATNADPWNEGNSFWGVRVVAIPEPAGGALFVLVGGLLWFVRRRARA